MCSLEEDIFDIEEGDDISVTLSDNDDYLLFDDETDYPSPPLPLVSKVTPVPNTPPPVADVALQQPKQKIIKLDTSNGRSSSSVSSSPTPPPPSPPSIPSLVLNQRKKWKKKKKNKKKFNKQDQTAVNIEPTIFRTTSLYTTGSTAIVSTDQPLENKPSELSRATPLFSRYALLSSRFTSGTTKFSLNHLNLGSASNFCLNHLKN